jgi:protein XagA
LFLFVLCLSGHAWGQVYSQHAGWVRLNQQLISSDSFFDSDSKPTTIRTNTLYITSLTAEVGLSNRLTSVLYLPFFVRSQVNNVEFNQSGNRLAGASLNTLGDAELGIRFAFRKKLPQVIGIATLGLPLGRELEVGSNSDLQTGDGEFNQLIGLQLLQEFKSISLSGQVSFNNRSQNFSNEIRYGVDVKYTGKKIGARFQFNAIESLFNDVAPVSLSGIFSNHREVFIPSLEVNVAISKHFWIFLSCDYIVAGRNTLNAPLWTTGLQYKLK